MQNFENIKEVVETIRQFSPGSTEDFVEGRGSKGKGSARFKFQLHSFTQLSLQGIRGVQEPPLTRSPGKESSLGATSPLKAHPGLKKKRNVPSQRTAGLSLCSVSLGLFPRLSQTTRLRTIKGQPLLSLIIPILQMRD